MAEEVLRNEAYMNDAVLSAFSNLHKAAKRKSDYIWSNNKFSSLNSIWGDYVQPKVNKIPEDASIIRNGSRNEGMSSKVVYSSNKLKSKTSKVYNYMDKTGSNKNEATLQTKQNDEHNDKANDDEEALSWKCQISLVFKTKNNVLTSSEVKYDSNYLEINGEEKNTVQRNYSGKDLENIPMERKTADCDQYRSEKVPLPIDQELELKDSRHISPKNASSSSSYGSPVKSGDLHEVEHYESEPTSDKYISSNAISRLEDDIVNQHQNRPKTFSYMKKTGNQISYFSDSKDLDTFSVLYNKDMTRKNISVLQSDLHPVPQGNSLSSREGRKLTDKMNFDTISESQSYLRSKVNDTDVKGSEKIPQRIKRTRHSSGASTSSTMPAQKKSTKAQNMNAQQLSPNTTNNVAKTMLCIKIMKGEKYFEIFVNASDFNRIKNKFPKLQEVFSDVSGDKREIKYCLEAVKVVFRSLFNPAFNFNGIPEGKVAMEILAATKSWEIIELHKKFQRVYLKKISKDNFNVTYPAAIHFGLSEICAAYKKFLRDSESPLDSSPYRQRKCFVSVSIYVEPQEFCISLHAATQSLRDQFPRDLSNEIIFEAVKGSYVITGFHILLNIADNSNNGTKHLDVFYSVQNLDDSDESEQLKITKPFCKNIVIHFRRKITVHQNQKAEIVIDTNISPYLCMATETNSLTEKTEEKEFILNLTSNFKVENSNEKRFFIEKLLYYPKNETS